MRRATGFCVAVAFTILPPGAFASPSPIGEPTLPELMKPPSRAACWYQRAADNGFSSAQVRLALLYQKGSGVKLDPFRAFDLYLEPAHDSDPTGERVLAFAFRDGVGTPSNQAEAVAWLQRAARHDDAEAMYLPANAYKHGVGIMRDPKMAGDYLRESAELGHALAAARLGITYAADSDPTQALQWLRSAVDAAAKALGVSMDPDEALTWYQLAGNNKVVAAQLRLGDIAHRGELGQLRDDHAALRWYGLAASQGSGEADERIGDLYLEGSIDLPRDPAEAVRYYSIAAAQGLASSARKLAVAYANGDGVAPDDALMLQWARRAAEAGDPVAAGMLGYSILIGIDGSYDLVEATTWLTLAIERAHSGDWRRHAAVFADDAQRKLTPVERHAFQARLARWHSTLDPE